MTTPAPPPKDEDEDRRADASILETLSSSRYAAFRTLPGRSRPRSRLLFVPRQGLWEWVDNGALWRMRARADGRQIGLTFHSMAVVIEGAGLMQAAFAIDRHNCLFLQQHDPERHGNVPEGEAIITTMKFFAQTAKLHPEAEHAELRH